jgi:hypothetical protein
MTTRSQDRRSQIEATGAECWLASPLRLASLRPALEQVTVVCWLLARATGPEDELRALHGSLLESFLGQIVDTGVRGFVYDASAGRLPRELRSAGALATRRIASLNAIPHEVIEADLGDAAGWLSQAAAALRPILEPSYN